MNNKTRKKKEPKNLYNYYMFSNKNLEAEKITGLNNIPMENTIDDVKTYFHIKTGDYIFNVVEHILDDVIEIKFFIKDENKKDDICVKVTVPREDHKIPGNIDTLYYNKDCSISKMSLEKKDGTIHMLKTALYYVYENYPYVKEYEIQDETHINDEKIGKPLITSRRLLFGQPGWYEEYFGAEPIRDTVNLIKQIKKNRKHVDELIKKYKPNTIGNEWFVPANILLITSDIKPGIVGNSIFNVSGKIFGTSWKITKNTIKGYRIKYRVESGNTEAVNTNYYKNYVNSQERTP